MKFAYLIMAYNNEKQLCKLLQLLDYEDTDIYLHIDKKSKEIDSNQIRSCVKKASLFLYRNYSVTWSGLSQTKCQMFLLGEAVKTYHGYYHLISGQDLPIKSHSEIVSFFTENSGKQFVHFERDGFCEKEVCKYYHFERPPVRNRGTSFFKAFFTKVEISLQKKLKVRRKFYCGANWYSITHDLACDFSKHAKYMLRKVKYTFSSDELILQTFLKTYSDKQYTYYALPYEPGDYSGLARKIDWYRGSPYVWTINDFNELINSNSVFARKFDERLDSEIINKLYSYLNSDT